MSIGVVGPQSDRRATLNDRFLDIALRTERVTNAVQGLGVIERKLEGFPVLGDGRVGFSFLQECVAEIDVRLRVTRPLFDRAPEMRYCFIRIALLEQDRTDVGFR